MLTYLKKYTICLIIILIPGLLYPQEGKVLNRVLKRGELRVGTTGNQPPFTVKTRHGDLIGYEIELATLLANAMNIKLTFVEKPFAELLPALENSEVDIVMSGMTITPERNLKCAFIGPYIVSGNSILVKSSRLAMLDEMGEINQPTVKIAVLKGSTSQRLVEKKAPNVKLITTSDHESAVKMVIENQVDLMIADYPTCIISAFRYPEAGLTVSDEPLSIEPIGLALPPDAFQLHNLIENYLNALEITGMLEALERKWFDDGSWLLSLP